MNANKNLILHRRLYLAINTYASLTMDGFPTRQHDAYTHTHGYLAHGVDSDVYLLALNTHKVYTFNTCTYVRTLK